MLPSKHSKYFVDTVHILSNEDTVVPSDGMYQQSVVFDVSKVFNWTSWTLP